MIKNSASVIILDDENPWPALSPFNEEGSHYFNGRDEEIAALRRTVSQAPLTVLFGQSGLGKTSLLKAGLFPHFRAENYLPVYVRLNVQDKEKPLINQVSEALQTEIINQGIDAHPFEIDETLWQYLHKDNMELWSAQNRLLVPLFVLDQFEEVITLSKGNSAAVEQLRIDLADLVENRIPAPIVALSEISVDSAAKNLDLQRQNYKILLSFREDFLPAFESWKKEMPSLQRNRFRLLPMTGEQALKAIHDTAPKLADKKIASEIVKFVAASQSSYDQISGFIPVTESATGKTSNVDLPLLVDLIVEPALLSLVCHGLNERRKQREMSAFDLSLLSGIGSTIIDEFYSRCLKDLPESINRFIENELITESGFRKPCAEDDATKQYSISDDDLNKLVDCRLLRIEPYHGTILIELIHDVLTPVVRQRRELQRELQRKIDRQAQLEEDGIKARQRRKYRILGASVVILLVVLGLVAWLAFFAKHQQKLAIEQQKLAELRLEQIKKSMKIRRETLSGKLEELASSLEKNNYIKFNASYKAMHYKTSNNNKVYKFSMFPDFALLPGDANSVASITYVTNHPSFHNKIITTSAMTQFTAEYTGWGCLNKIVALIEYSDLEKTPTVAEFDACKLLGW